MRCAIFSCMGLGDGLIALVLAQNLRKNGHEVITFHPSLNQLQGWFPTLPLRPFPHLEELRSFDRFFIFYEKSAWMLEVIGQCQRCFPEKTTIINPIATKNTDYPYWEQARFDGRNSFVDNLVVFCRDILHLKEASKENGIVPPVEVKPRLLKKRVILHTTSSRPGKNWPLEKYEQLAELLKGEGYDPLLVSEFPTLSALAAFVCESGYMIGNCSGVGHLASCLGLPTVTICRNGATANFWRPGWASSQVVIPPPWIPNMKGLRLRDQRWQKWIGVRTVFKRFLAQIPQESL